MTRKVSLYESRTQWGFGNQGCQKKSRITTDCWHDSRECHGIAIAWQVLTWKKERDDLAIAKSNYMTARSATVAKLPSHRMSFRNPWFISELILSILFDFAVEVRLDQVMEVLDKNRLNQDLVVFVNYSKVGGRLDKQMTTTAATTTMTPTTTTMTT